MHYVKDVFSKKGTEHAHDKFVRYSKGEFCGPLLKIRFTAKNIKVYGSFHFVDELLMLACDLLGNKEVHVKGTLLWNSDLAEELASLGIKYSKVTKSRGIFKYVLDNDVKIKDFVDTFGKYNLLVTIKEDEFSYVTKTNFPKPNKDFASDFCKVTFPQSMAKKIKDEFLFDVKEDKIKEAIVTHTIAVNDIHLPKDYASFEQARQEATREGTIERKVSINKGDEVVSSVAFNM